MATSIKKLIEQGKKAPMPKSIAPMLCTLTRKPINNPDYIYEVKLDGYRLIAHCTGTTVRLDSRSSLDYTSKYPPLVKNFKKIKHKMVLDGEAVVLNEEGKPDFDALQTFNGKHDPIYYYAFDILWLDGYDLKHLPLLSRKAILEAILKENEVIRYTEHFADGVELYNQILGAGLEGIIAKRADSIYQPGQRGNDWLKIPTEIRQEFVIGGWVESDKDRPFRSLLFGAYKDKKLEWIGHAGGGFTDKQMVEIFKKLKPLEIKKTPFVNKVDTDGVAHWVKPKLVANFKFATWTKSGRIRKPAIFLGFRNDKASAQVTREVPLEAPIISEEPVREKKSKRKIKASRLPTMAASNWPKVENQKIENEDDFVFGDCSIRLTNVEREIWKSIIKADLIQYYHSVAKYILPHIKDHPQSLHIKLINATGPGFYIKDMEGRQPACAEIFTVPRKHDAAGKRKTIDYLVANNVSTLLWMVNLGCIDINPWASRTTSPENPDYIIIDLDPSDDDFKKAIETAKATKQLLDEYKLKSYLKTSGKTGIHILVPCEGFTHKQVRGFAHTICEEIQKLVPSITTTAFNKSDRGTKLLIDENQNDYADTIAAPYSVRPFHHPSVSTPLEWKELKPSLDPLQFDIFNTKKRVEKKRDLFMPVLDKKIAQANSIKLERLFF